VERTSLVVCAAMAAVALALARGRTGPALGVLGGGALIALSYHTIGSGVSALVAAVSPHAIDGAVPARPPRMGLTLAKVVSRYALLALLAYVMIARLRLHPVGLLAGASSVVAAVSIEAVRLLKKKNP
jgi:hypothetical protein